MDSAKTTKYVLDVNGNGQFRVFDVLSVKKEIEKTNQNQGEEGMLRCPYCPQNYYENQQLLLATHIANMHPVSQAMQEEYNRAINKMPEGQGKRDKEMPHFEYIPLEFLTEIASIFEEGRKPRPGLPEGYGDSWKAGGKDFLRDCLNHAVVHLFKYLCGDRTENHLSKVAWNVLVVRFFDLKEKQASELSK